MAEPLFDDQTTRRRGRFTVVLLADVVAFTKLPSERQVEVRARLTTLVSEAFKFHQGSTIYEGPLARMTGDGFYFATFDYPEVLLQIALETMQRVAEEDFEIRVGLNAGICFLVPDAQGQRDLVGDAINMASRLLTAADAGHILASRSFFDLLRNTRFGTLFHPVGTVKVKHGELIEVFNVHDGDVGNSRDPRTDRHTTSADTLELTDAEDAKLCSYLLMMNGADFGDTNRIDGSCCIGRAKDCEVTLDDRTVSRQHCIIETRGSGLRLRDLGSANGTLVNGLRVDEGMLEHDDIVVVGHQYFRVLRCPPDRLAAARDAEMRRIATSDERTGFMRYGHFLERVDVELQRARAARRPLIVVAFTSPVIHELEDSPRAEVLLGLFWKRALAPLARNLCAWDTIGSTRSLQVVYAVLPERPSAEQATRELNSSLEAVNAGQVDVMNKRLEPQVSISVVEAQSAHYPSPDALLAYARRVDGAAE